MRQSDVVAFQLARRSLTFAVKVTSIARRSFGCGSRVTKPLATRPSTRPVTVRGVTPSAVASVCCVLGLPSRSSQSRCAREPVRPRWARSRFMSSFRSTANSSMRLSVARISSISISPEDGEAGGLEVVRRGDDDGSSLERAPSGPGGARRVLRGACVRRIRGERDFRPISADAASSCSRVRSTVDRVRFCARLGRRFDFRPLRRTRRRTVSASKQNVTSTTVTSTKQRRTKARRLARVRRDALRWPRGLSTAGRTAR
jgi:hypothetical protein